MKTFKIVTNFEARDADVFVKLSNSICLTNFKYSIIQFVLINF